MTVFAFDLETRLLASEVEREFAAELAGKSAWERPDLFGFAVGVAVDVGTGEVLRYGPGGAPDMLEALREADVTCGYNTLAFDLGVLSAYGEVEALRERHVDLCVAVREALEDLRGLRFPDADRLRQRGLDGLARSNGFSGKTGDGADAPALFREGRVEELLDYCEADVRLVADLYRIVFERGGLHVDPYYRDENRERVFLPRTSLHISL